MIVLTILLALWIPQDTSQEKRRIPEDSVQLTVVGCLHGRVLRTLDQRTKDVESGPYVGERKFRVAGKKDVMTAVKKYDRQLVEVVGLVRRADLDDKGITVGGIAISGGPPVSGRNPGPGANIPVLDVETVRLRAGSCSGEPNDNHE
jgi:hypothetical protein